MGWGESPANVRAAEEARAEAVRRAENKPMSPFERTMIGVLEDIRDAVKPTPLEPIAGSVELMATGCCSGAAASLDPLLDSAPAVLARSVQAAGLALANAFPAFREDLTAAGFEKFAEVAIEAALHEAARDRTDEDVAPRRLDIDAALAPATSHKLAEQVWRGPGLYELTSTKASTTVYATHIGDLAEAVKVHPVDPTKHPVGAGDPPGPASTGVTE